MQCIHYQKEKSSDRWAMKQVKNAWSLWQQFYAFGLDFAIIDLQRKNAFRVPNPLVNQDNIYFYSSIDSHSINGMLYHISTASEE